MIFFGLVLLLLGLGQLYTPLRLMVFGQRATAEAIAVIKSKQGQPDLVLTNELQVQRKIEAHDRAYIFWTLFSYHTSDGRTVEVRSPIGSKLKPLYPLLDTDGLPTTDLLYYDPRNPGSVVFPLTVSTWFAEGVFVIAGLLCLFIGIVLTYWADKPIELPHIPTPDPVSTA
jgi:hypothetical protein